MKNNELNLTQNGITSVIAVLELDDFDLMEQLTNISEEINIPDSSEICENVYSDVDNDEKEFHDVEK